MTESRLENAVTIKVTCKHCKRTSLTVTHALPICQCDAGESSKAYHAWQVEHEFDCCSNLASSASAVPSSVVPSNSPSGENGTSVDQVGIIIVGRPGAGKSTLVEKGLFPNCPDVKVVESIKDPQMEIITCSHNGVQYKIAMISNIDCHSKVEPELTVCWRKLHSYKEKFPKKVSLILFVYRHGRFTDEEKTLFYLAKQCFQSASALCATVITNCDGMTLEAKRKIVADFRKNINTKELAAFMKKEPGICCVSFPHIEKLAPGIQDIYKEEFSLSRIALGKLLELNEIKKSIDEVLWQKSASIQGPGRPRP